MNSFQKSPLHLQKWPPCTHNSLYLQHLYQVNVINKVPLLNDVQPDITYNITVSKPGDYVVVVNYLTPITDKRTHNVSAEVLADQTLTKGQVILYSCPYTTVCRQVITDEQTNIGVHRVNGNSIIVTLKVCVWKI